MTYCIDRYLSDGLCQLGLLVGLCFSLQAGLSGCALSYVDDKGVKHVMGLVNMEIEPAATTDRTIAESVQIQTVGFSLYSTAIHRGVVLGYSRENLTTLYNNAVVGDPMAISHGRE